MGRDPSPRLHLPAHASTLGAVADTLAAVNASASVSLLIGALGLSLPLGLELAIAVHSWSVQEFGGTCKTVVRCGVQRQGCPTHRTDPPPAKRVHCAVPKLSPCSVRPRSQLLRDPLMQSRLMTWHGAMALLAGPLNIHGTPFLVPLTAHGSCTAALNFFWLLFNMAVPLVLLARVGG